MSQRMSQRMSQIFVYLINKIYYLLVIMVLTEILSTSFLFSIAIIIILVGGLFAYFNHRITQQNHKISSMLELVSTIANEMQFFRSKLRNNVQEQPKMPDADIINFNPHFFGGKLNTENIVDNNTLIEVSDDESEIDDSDIDMDSVSDESDDSGSDLDEDEDEDEDINIKNISINLGNEIDIDLTEISNNDINNIDDINNINNDNIKTITLSQDLDSSNNTFENVDDIALILTNSTAENKIDYKKMSLNKLRDLVIEKGLVVDASKLKKNDILKMLGDE